MQDLPLHACRGAAIATFGQSYEATTGRLASASFGTSSFAYSYLGNTGLVSSMTTANGAAVKSISYEANRDLPTEIKYQTADENPALIAKRNYSFDALGRVSSRSQTRGSDAARNDAFGYNDRSELTSATIGADSYAYAFDDIGNRLTAEELAAETEYASNNLNQYSQIAKEGEAAFSPTYDDDGNQTLVKTSTGIWSVEYNGENRPVKFANGTTVVECKYDSQGRRYEKKVAVDGVTTFWQRYAYRNYLQIAAFDVSLNPDANEEVLTLAATTAWDPAEPLATRPLAFTDHAGDAPATYFHTHDLTKNVCELLDATGAIVASYDYAPFGAVALSGTSTRNPFQFSSEFHDPETALVYYNYRHYNPLDGRWISRDPLEERTIKPTYLFIGNDLFNQNDFIGLMDIPPKCPPRREMKITFFEYRIQEGNITYYVYSYQSNEQNDKKISVDGCSVPRILKFGNFAHFANIFEAACNQHDICYGTCGTEKEVCDTRFEQDMKKICRNYSGERQEECIKYADIFSFAVLHFGLGRYNDAQREHCKRLKCSICRRKGEPFVFK